MKFVDTLIIGGGFSGFALAKLFTGYTMVTASEGGLLRGFKSNGFTFDIGGHVYTTNDEALNQILKGCDPRFHDRHAVFAARLAGEEHAQFFDYPIQQSLSHLVKPSEQRRMEFSLEDHLVNSFGVGFYEDFLKGFNTRVWSTPPSEMSAKWVKNRVQPVSSAKTKEKWGPNAKFQYATGKAIIERMKSLAPHGSIIAGKVVGVSIEDKVVMIETADGYHTLRYERLIDTSGMFIRGERSNSILVIGLGFDTRLPTIWGPDDFHWLYGAYPGAVHRVTLLSKYHEDLAPAGCDSLLLEIPYHNTYAPLPLEAIKMRLAYERADFPVAIKLAMKMLDDTGMLIGAKGVKTIWCGMFQGYPVQLVGTFDRVRQRKQELMDQNVFLAGRWGSHSYYNLEHILKDAEAVHSAVIGGGITPYLDSTFYYTKGE